MPGNTASFAANLNRDCHCVGTDLPQVRRWIEHDLLSHGITEPLLKTHPHLFSAVPVFVEPAHIAAAHTLVRAVEAVVALPAYREAALGWSPPMIRSDDPTRGMFLGYDFHLGAEGPRLIEINTNPGGAMLNTLLIRAQHACCPEIRPLTPRPEDAAAIEREFVSMLRREWALARGDAPLHRVAIVDDAPETQFLYPEFLLFRKLFESDGLATVIADPRELEFDGAKVRHAGRDIDLIYNRLTDFYLQLPQHGHLSEAWAADAVVLTPHPRSHALYANKRNLTLLSDATELRALGAPAEAIDILLRHIPRTRSVAANERDRWWAERRQWFFKPTCGFAGRGAYRGDKLTRKMFEDVMSGDYVAQQIVPPGTRHCEPDARPLRWDLRIYAYEATPLLQAARLYEGQTTNFRTSGGGFAPVFVTSRERIAADADGTPTELSEHLIVRLERSL